MKIAARDVASLLKAPGSRFSAYLLYGPDQGLVRERARLLAHHFCDSPDDPFAQANLTGQHVSEDKARLTDETNAVNVFLIRHPADWTKQGLHYTITWRCSKIIFFVFFSKNRPVFRSKIDLLNGF